jgi:murein DD-endopeptidase MepM/ murein hydrolase activator NlpD
MDAGFGAAAALAVLGLAQTARPKAEPARLEASAVRLTSAPTAATAQPPVLIAFAQPVAEGSVVSPFGLRQLPWEASGRLHEGVDILAEPGTPVRAAADGVVVESGADAGYGRFVEVRHAEGLTTLYAHLKAIDPHVTAGVALKAGQTLGAVGSTGSSTGPHLHFEIRDARDRPLNPAMFLGKAFAEADDLPLRSAQRFGRRVRIAHVSMIPASKRALMAERAAADAMNAGADAVAHERIDGLKNLRRDSDGRAHAQLTL